MNAKMLTPGKCLLLHRWREVVDTGFTVYTECKDCKSRKVRQREGGYQPVNLEWVCGLATNEQLRSNTALSRVADSGSDQNESTDSATSD